MRRGGEVDVCFVEDEEAVEVGMGEESFYLGLWEEGAGGVARCC